MLYNYSYFRFVCSLKISLNFFFSSNLGYNSKFIYEESGRINAKLVYVTALYIRILYYTSFIWSEKKIPVKYRTCTLCRYIHMTGRMRSLDKPLSWIIYINEKLCRNVMLMYTNADTYIHINEAFENLFIWFRLKLNGHELVNKIGWTTRSGFLISIN